jgi:hypothetical protein
MFGVLDDSELKGLPALEKIYQYELRTNATTHPSSVRRVIVSLTGPTPVSALSSGKSTA